jgi:hypothetical protein
MVSAQRLRIGVLYSGEGIFASFGATVRPITEAWAAGVAGIIVGGRPQIFYCDIASNFSQVVPCTQQLLSYNVSIIIPGETSLTTPTAVVTNDLGIPVLASMAASTDVFFSPGHGPFTSSPQRQWSHLFGVMTPSQNYFNTLLSILSSKGQKTMSIISVGSLPDVDVCNGAMYRAAYESIQVFDFISIPSVDPGYVYLGAAVTQVSESAPDILLVCNRLACTQTLDYLVTQDYTPQTLAMFECGNTIDKTAGNKAAYVVTPLQFDDRLRGFDYSDPPHNSNNSSLGMFPYVPPNGEYSAQQFSDWLSNLLGASTFNSLVAPQLTVLYVIEQATKLCNCTNPSGLMAILPWVTFNCFYGKVQFDNYGQNNRDIVLIQLDSQLNSQIISPASSLTSELITPAPKWHERDYQFKYFSYKSEQIMYCLLLCVFVLNILVGILVYRNRNHPAVRGVSVNFLLFSLCGWGILLVSPLSWPIDNTLTHCRLRISFVCGIITILAPWMLKTWRIDMIFNDPLLIRKTISDMKVVALVVIILVITLLISILGFVVYPYQLNTIIVDPLRPSYNLNQCVTTNENVAYLYVLIVEVILMIVVTAYLAYSIRNVSENFNDAMSIFWSLMTLLALFICVAMVETTKNTNPSSAFNAENGSFIIRCVLIMICWGMSCVLYYDRLEKVYRSRNPESGVTMVHTPNPIQIRAPVISGNLVTGQTTDSPATPLPHLVGKSREK